MRTLRRRLLAVTILGVTLFTSGLVWKGYAGIEGQPVDTEALRHPKIEGQFIALFDPDRNTAAFAFTGRCEGGAREYVLGPVFLNSFPASFFDPENLGFSRNVGDQRKEFVKLAGARGMFHTMILRPDCKQPATKRDGYDEQSRQRYSCRPCHRDFTATSTSAFSGYRWPADVILTAVRWYASYPLSATHVMQLLAERHIDVSARAVSQLPTFFPSSLNPIALLLRLYLCTAVLGAVGDAGRQKGAQSVSLLSSPRCLLCLLSGVLLLSLCTFAVRTANMGRKRLPEAAFSPTPLSGPLPLAQTAPLSPTSPAAPVSATRAAREKARAVASPVFAFPTESAPSAGQHVISAPLPGELSPQPDFRIPSEPVNRERYASITANPLQRVAEQPVSTFSIDVDTGAYANVRRFLHNGTLPVRDAVRVEELINYFSYDYPPPETAATPFHLTTEIAPTPWNPNTLLLLVGLKGYVVPQSELPPANLVFLIDVSGSMQSPDKLDLVKSALLLLCRQLRGSDRISLVAYAGASGVVLDPTPGDQTGKIQAAIESLTAGGSTNGGAGIRLAYAMAEQGYIPGGINRVLLATDGDFNVGTVSLAALKDLIAEKRTRGIALTTLGVGSGNYNDALMEQLADVGNGTYAYLDSLQEAQKVLVTERAATLYTIAKDIKVQLEFNPAVVAEYRLIGYENRMLRREDFSNDAVDAGEIGAGHTVTALYEIALVGSKGLRLEPLRYAPPSTATEVNTTELGFLRLRYKAPDSETSQVLEWPLPKDAIAPEVAQTTERFRFAAAVAAFGQLLRGGTYTGTFGYADVLTLARGARADDPFGQKGEFLSLVRLAQSLSHPEAGAPR